MSKELIFYGKSFGATYNRTSLYIKSQGARAGFTNEFLLGVMHSEFSSILMHNYFFSENVWKSANYSAFEYIGNGREICLVQVIYFLKHRNCFQKDIFANMLRQVLKKISI